MKSALVAVLVFAMASQAALCCAFTTTQAARDICCAVDCGHDSTPSSHCCKVSPRPESAEVAPAASNAAQAWQLAAIFSVAHLALPPALTVGSVASRRARPPTAVFDQLCSLQI